MLQSQILSVDLKMMERYIELSKVAAANGELPFASLICRDGRLPVETLLKSGR
jgi:hypothetical protein